MFIFGHLNRLLRSFFLRDAVAFRNARNQTPAPSHSTISFHPPLSLPSGQEEQEVVDSMETFIFRPLAPHRLEEKTLPIVSWKMPLRFPWWYSLPSPPKSMRFFWSANPTPLAGQIGPRPGIKPQFPTFWRVYKKTWWISTQQTLKTWLESTKKMHPSLKLTVRTWNTRVGRWVPWKASWQVRAVSFGENIFLGTKTTFTNEHFCSQEEKEEKPINISVFDKELLIVFPLVLSRFCFWTISMSWVWPPPSNSAVPCKNPDCDYYWEGGHTESMSHNHCLDFLSTTPHPKQPSAIKTGRLHELSFK